MTITTDSHSQKVITAALNDALRLAVEGIEDAAENNEVDKLHEHLQVVRTVLAIADSQPNIILDTKILQARKDIASDTQNLVIPLSNQEMLTTLGSIFEDILPIHIKNRIDAIAENDAELAASSLATIDTILTLCQSNINLNKPMNDNKVALISAVENKDEALARLLLKHGATPHYAPEGQDSAMAIADENGEDSLKTLLNKNDATKAKEPQRLISDAGAPKKLAQQPPHKKHSGGWVDDGSGRYDNGAQGGWVRD
jgi:ankyrin repeat protein